MWPEPEEEEGQWVVHTSGGNAAFHNFVNDYSHIRDST
jgi:hypothetical protein